MPLTLYRLRDESELTQKWMGNASFAFLAGKRPEAYDIRDYSAELSPADVPPGSAIVVKMLGHLLDRVKWVFRQPGVRDWIAAGIPVVFDDSTEASLSGAEQWAWFRRTLQDENLPPGRFVWLQQNVRGPDDCAAAFRGETQHQVRSVVVHYWMHRLRIDAVDVPARPQAGQREKRFLCLNYKLRTHRAALLGWLLREGLFDRGLVSFGWQMPGTTNFRWKTFEEFEAFALGDFPGFAAEIAENRTLMQQPEVLGEGTVQARQVRWDIHARAGFSLVSETEMRSGDTLRFTEKTLKALAAWHPVVVAGNAGVLGLLREHGFQTFAPWIDESYDLIAAREERLRAVLGQAKRLIEMPEPEFDRLLAEMEPVLAHNHRHFMDGLPAIMDQQHAAFQRAVAELVSGA